VDEREGSGRRKWVMIDVYCNTNPETEVIIFEMPGGRVDGRELARLVHSERRWLTQGFTGDTSCECAEMT
jgi:hypothetical protein